MGLKKTGCALLAAVMLVGCGTSATENGYETEATKDVSAGQTTETENARETEAETQTAQETEEATETETQETAYPELVSDDKLKDYGTVVTVGDAAYELYTYLDDVADDYAKSVNLVTENLAGAADVYDMIVPLSSGITFPDNLTDQISSSNQQEAVQSIQDKLGDAVHRVEIYDTLMQHRNEYIYYRTDHHWTTLGAYYAYREFCTAAGLLPEELDSYETAEFDGFLGSFYNDTEDGKLGKNPDTVTAYYPKADSICHVTASDGMEYDWPVIYDVSNYGASLKYSAFIASDNPYTEIVNKDLTDGSSCIVVKESFGNALVPFLVDHYETIYVIDYRYWTGSISELAQDKGIQTVLFINNLSAIRNKSLVGKLYRVV